MKIYKKQHLRAWTDLRCNKNKSPAMIASKTLFCCSLLPLVQ
ncbi:conserved hypothetical protein [delta proteobacterium NaphS2]|nr:conserved hypothetical protein [delta proteobacterium NaphS2]